MKCAYQETAATLEELKAKIVAHTQSAHNMKEIPREVMSKIEAAIKDV